MNFEEIEGLEEQFQIATYAKMNIAVELGLAPGSNIGEQGAVFEAVHGSAPDIAGQGIANPTAILMSGIMMLRHLGERDAAQRVEDAMMQVFAEGEFRTKDLGGTAKTAEFANAIIDKLKH